jgi:hypothetical protein
MGENEPVQIRASTVLASDEKELLSDLLQGISLYHDERLLSPLPPPPPDSSISASDGTWQPDFGFDLQTVLTLLLAPLPALFLKSLAEETGKKFWDGILALHKKIAARKKATPLRGLQTRLRTRSYKGIPIDVVLTMPNALYMDPEPMAEIIKQCWASLPEYQRAAEAMIDTSLGKLGSKDELRDKAVVIHGVVRSNKPNWKITSVDL